MITYDAYFPNYHKDDFMDSTIPVIDRFNMFRRINFQGVSQKYIDKVQCFEQFSRLNETRKTLI